MTTTIGSYLQQNRMRAWLALLVGAVTLEIDWLYSVGAPYLPRSFLIIIAVIALLIVNRGDTDSLGLTFRILPNFKAWLGITLRLGLLLLVFILVALFVLKMLGEELLIPHLSADEDWLWLHHFEALCVSAPLKEEPLYRLVLCVPLVALCGPRTAIIVSGMVFGALHFHYGNPGPDNFIAGYVLAWAYLRSGTLLIPIMLHSLGNFCVMLMQMLPLPQ